MQVYLDNSATTQPFPRVVAVMREAMETGWYNPSALYKPAMEAETVSYTHLKQPGWTGNQAAYRPGQRRVDSAGG